MAPADRMSYEWTMRLFFQQFFAIARLALLETLRQPVVMLITLVCLVFIALLPVLITHVMGDGQRIVRDSALAIHLMAGLILGSYAACASLRDEVRRGTASAVLSKPVGRDLFLLAKFAGLALVMILFSTLLALAVILTARTAAQDYIFDWWGAAPLLAAILGALVIGGLQNFLLQKPFASRAFGALLILVPLALLASGLYDDQGARTADFGVALSWVSLPASLLITMAILLLAGCSVSLATRLDVVPTLACCAALLMGGLMADYLLGQAARDHFGAALLYGLLPNFQHFWAVDALARGEIPWSYVGQAAEYGALYLAGILGLGIVAFRHMELRG